MVKYNDTKSMMPVKREIEKSLEVEVTGTNLDYAPPLPVWRRKRTQRRIILATVAIVVISGIWWIPTAWHELRLRYMTWSLWRQCTEYTAAPDQIVYDDGASAADLLKADPGLTALHLRLWPPDAPRARRSLQVWEDLRPYIEFECLTIRPPTPVLFMHKRTTSSGYETLVVIEMDIQHTGSVWPENLDISHINLISSYPYPASLLKSPVRHGGVNREFRVRTEGESGPIRFFAGQPDPNDASHFTIRYEENGLPGFIDGWLKHWYESCTVELKDNPPLRSHTPRSEAN